MYLRRSGRQDWCHEKEVQSRQDRPAACQFVLRAACEHEGSGWQETPLQTTQLGGLRAILQPEVVKTTRCLICAAAKQVKMIWLVTRKLGSVAQRRRGLTRM